MPLPSQYLPPSGATTVLISTTLLWSVLELDMSGIRQHVLFAVFGFFSSA